MIYKREYEKFYFNEEGLHYENNLIAYCNPVVVKKVRCFDISQKVSFIKYFVKVEFIDGTEGECVELASLDNISCFDLWQCPNINISGKEQKLIVNKLQLEAARKEAEESIICNQGLQSYNGKSIYVLGNRVIGAENLKEEIVLKSNSIFYNVDNIQSEQLGYLAKQIMKIMPGSSEIMFYYSLQAIVKPILCEMGINTNYILAVVGPSGHLKTSLAKTFYLWLEDEGKQKVGFSSLMRTYRILEAIDENSGMNYLVDDFHIYEKTQDITRQNKRLDDIVRHIEEKTDCANVVITGEYVQGIFSCLDRMFVLEIPKMNEVQLTDLKANLNMISKGLMPMIAFSFAKALMENLMEVKEVCNKFYQENCINPNPGNENATRTYRHSVFLKLTELLYRKYMCNNSKEMSCYNELEYAIANHYEMQQKKLRSINIAEQYDYVSDVINMLNGNNKYLEIKINSDKYIDYEHTCIQQGDFIYITRNALRYGMMKYYQRTVNINKIVRKLEDEGILNIGTDTLTKKYRNKRHYVISVEFLKLYKRYKENSDTVV